MLMLNAMPCFIEPWYKKNEMNWAIKLMNRFQNGPPVNYTTEIDVDEMTVEHNI